MPRQLILLQLQRVRQRHARLLARALRLLELLERWHRLDDEAVALPLVALEDVGDDAVEEAPALPRPRHARARRARERRRRPARRRPRLARALDHHALSLPHLNRRLVRARVRRTTREIPSITAPRDASVRQRRRLVVVNRRE